jgi:hypothetical protein
MRIDFEPESHTYEVDGTEVPSVTQVLSSEGLSGNGNGYWKEEHRLRGTAVHKVALLLTKRPIKGRTREEIVDGSLWDPRTTAPILVPYGLACAAYLSDSGFRPEHIELPVASLKLGVAGTLDAWGKMPDGRRTIVDWKSGQPGAAADVQTAGYAVLLEESRGLQTDQRVVVWLQSSGDYKAYPARPAGGQDLAIWMAAVNLYKWRQAHKLLG